MVPQIATRPCPWDSVDLFQAKKPNNRVASSGMYASKLVQGVCATWVDVRCACPTFNCYVNWTSQPYYDYYVQKWFDDRRGLSFCDLGRWYRWLMLHSGCWKHRHCWHRGRRRVSFFQCFLQCLQRYPQSILEVSEWCWKIQLMTHWQRNHVLVPKKQKRVDTELID